MGGSGVEDEVEELWCWVAFDVEFGGEVLFEVVYVGESDVSLVGSGVHGYAVGSEGLDVERGLEDVGGVASSCVAEGGYFVDVDA